MALGGHPLGGAPLGGSGGASVQPPPDVAADGPPTWHWRGKGVDRRRRARVAVLDAALRHTGQEPPPFQPALAEVLVARGRDRKRRARIAVLDGSLFSTGFEVLQIMQPLVVRGRDRRRRARVAVAAPHLVDWAKRYHSARGLYRVFGAAAYRFFRSNVGPPSESDSPFATSSSLPHEPTDTYADGTWWLSVSYTNGLIDSGFLPIGPRGETYLRLDLSGGAEVDSPPQGPLDWRLELREGGVVAVVAVYLETDSLRATSWAIAYTTDGSTPAEDAPDVTVTMPTAGLAILDYELPAQANGTTVKVRLQTVRGSSYSENSTAKTATADATGPSAPAAGEAWRGPLPGEV